MIELIEINMVYNNTINQYFSINLLGSNVKLIKTVDGSIQSKLVIPYEDFYHILCVVYDKLIYEINHTYIYNNFYVECYKHIDHTYIFYISLFESHIKIYLEKYHDLVNFIELIKGILEEDGLIRYIERTKNG